MKELPPPDLSLGSFKLWVHGRQYPEEMDYWDGNWLEITANCTGTSSSVYAEGPILHLSEIQQWLDDCKQLYASLAGEALMECMEPNLCLNIKMEDQGHCVLSVAISSDPLYETHSFIFELDQSYLPGLIQSLESILETYPISGAKQ